MEGSGDFGGEGKDRRGSEREGEEKFDERVD